MKYKLSCLAPPQVQNNLEKRKDIKVSPTRPIKQTQHACLSGNLKARCAQFFLIGVQQGRVAYLLFGQKPHLLDVPIKKNQTIMIGADYFHGYVRFWHAQQHRERVFTVKSSD